jgi:hypothetical protein
MKVSAQSKRHLSTRELLKGSIPTLLRPVQSVIFFSTLAFLLSACGYAGRPPVKEVTVVINPTSAGLALNQTLQFQAAVTGSANTAVTWDVNNVTGGNASVGTISSTGLYTAPPPNVNTVTVTAVSQASPQNTASAIVTLTNAIQINVSPQTASVPAGGAQAFTATVSGAGNLPTVTWSVNGIGGGNSTVGAIISNGPDTSVYTAPVTIPSPATVTITATSTADPTKSGNATATITCENTNSISPASASVNLGELQAFTASLCAAPGAQIIWDVNGFPGGNTTFGTIVVISATTATFTAPQNLPTPSSFQIHATAGAATASATVTIVSNIAVSISPASVTLNLSQRQTFTPTVTNTTNLSLTWTVNGIPNGSSAAGQVCQQGTNPCQPPTIPSSGSIDYIAPSALPAPDPVTLTATSTADPSRSGGATITIAGAPTNVSVTISPFYVFLAPSTGTPSTRQFLANVAGSANINVTWSIQSAVSAQGCTGAACGSISATGLYTAPVTAPSPNAISAIATSAADPTKSAAATIAIASGPVIEVMLPSSVFSGAVESFPLAVQGANFIPGTGASASAILINGVPRGTSCATSTGCATALNLADVQNAGALTIQIKNPAPSGALSNPVPFVIVPLESSVGAISLTTANPSSTPITLLVPEPTTAAESAPINVDSIGALTAGNCEIAGSPVTVTRPTSGTSTASLCIHGNGLDPTFLYSFTGAGGAPSGSDMGVTASALTGLFPNTIELDLQVSSTTLPGARTLFITTLNNDRAVATGMLEVK